MIELLTGPYKGTLYTYDWVRLSEESSLSIAKLSFNYTIIRNTRFTNDPQFEHYAGDVLQSILNAHDSKIGKLNGSKSTKANTTVIHTR